MSDLTATNCGCGCENGYNNASGNSLFGGDCGCSILWILLLCSLCNGNGGSLLSNNGCDGGNNCWIIILLLLCCCNGSNGYNC